LPYLVILNSQSGLSQTLACLRCRMLHILERIKGTDFLYFVGPRCKIINIITYETTSVVWWSEFLATNPEARVRFPALPEKSSWSGTGSTEPREYN
jgi:phage FluMu protein Com